MKNKNIDNAVPCLQIKIDGQDLMIPEGPVGPEIRNTLLGELMEQWPRLVGGRETAMNSDKVFRAEQLRIENGRIRFEIERHARTMNGSTRADVHTWEVDLVHGTASIINESFRQLTPTSKPFRKSDARLAAKAVLTLLAKKRKKNDKLTESAPGRFSLRAASFVDLGQYKQTQIGRHRQFLTALKEEIEPEGWIVESNPWNVSAIHLRKG